MHFIKTRMGSGVFHIPTRRVWKTGCFFGTLPVFSRCFFGSLPIFFQMFLSAWVFFSVLSRFFPGVFECSGVFGALCGVFLAIILLIFVIFRRFLVFLKMCFLCDFLNFRFFLKVFAKKYIIIHCSI